MILIIIKYFLFFLINKNKYIDRDIIKLKDNVIKEFINKKDYIYNS